MSKVKTKLHHDGDKVHVHRSQECQPILDSAAALRSNGLTGSSDFRHVGRIPFVVLEMWLNESGVVFSDTNAVKEVIRKNLQSGNFSRLRVDERSW